jgi:phosphonate transport system substrate-binding protein
MPAVFGEIIVPQDSHIRNLEDLAGEDVVFPGPEALVAYKFPYAHLIDAGIDVRVVFGGNMDGALSQLFSGKVLAAGVNSQLAEGYAHRENKKYRVLWKSDPLHDLALMVSGKVPEKTARAVAHAFVNMHRDKRGREILHQVSQAVGLADNAYFIPSNGSEYASYRKFYQTAPSQLR